METARPASSYPSSEPEEKEETIYQSVSSGLNEKIDQEMERLQELSMEVIPIMMQESFQ
jgi:hypothetical protein